MSASSSASKRIYVTRCSNKRLLISPPLFSRTMASAENRRPNGSLLVNRRSCKHFFEKIKKGIFIMASIKFDNQLEIETGAEQRCRTTSHLFNRFPVLSPVFVSFLCAIPLYAIDSLVIRIVVYCYCSLTMREPRHRKRIIVIMRKN